MSDRIALITGAASGIGAATARRLSQSVGGLVLVDRSREALHALAEELRGPELLLRDCDVGSEPPWSELEEAVERRFGRLDHVVANAGVAHGAPLAETSFEDWRRVLSANLDGVFLTLRAGLRLLRKAGQGGTAVVVSSVAAVKAEPGIGAYAASKAGAAQLVRVAAKEGAPDRIRVNGVLPGGVETPIWTQTPFFQALVTTAGSERAAFDQMAAMATPLGRYATADEIAGIIAFLLSDASATMTGALVVSDGGYSL
ncbi:SDR family NAD(P)-dependent oxidoreductase [Sorangium cellulosum]|uniref:Oxidoreductase n=1 Tax=Sorangium cellulosum TaxID=56 RepID=A0A150QLT3_SORCE|nr:SDR family oxidoreductase [Sorangium cellulosum]KYF68903.1 oxidoreductase [Sorangium cellulosum]